jgi:hypothetical protein
MSLLTEIFRVWNSAAANLGKTVTASGNMVSLPGGAQGPTVSCGNIDYLDVNINVTSLRGTGASIAFAWSRIDGPFGSAYQLGSASMSSPGKATIDVGPGLQNGFNVGQSGQFSWTLGGNAYSTTVTTGANSATQTVGSTSNMIVGDTLFFHTANVTVTVVSITDSTHVVVSAAVNSTTSETVTVSSTPAATFTALGEGK